MREPAVVVGWSSSFQNGSRAWQKCHQTIEDIVSLLHVVSETIREGRSWGSSDSSARRAVVRFPSPPLAPVRTCREHRALALDRPGSAFPQEEQPQFQPQELALDPRGLDLPTVCDLAAASGSVRRHTVPGCCWGEPGHAWPRESTKEDRFFPPTDELDETKARRRDPWPAPRIQASLRRIKRGRHGEEALGWAVAARRRSRQPGPPVSTRPFPCARFVFHADCGTRRDAEPRPPARMDLGASLCG